MQNTNALETKHLLEAYGSAKSYTCINALAGSEYSPGFNLLTDGETKLFEISKGQVMSAAIYLGNRLELRNI